MKKALALILILGLPTIAFSACQDAFQNGYIAGNYGQAFTECVSQAEQGDVYAQTVVGIMYKEGAGVQKDYQLAVLWYRRAAEQGGGGKPNMPSPKCTAMVKA